MIEESPALLTNRNMSVTENQFIPENNFIQERRIGAEGKSIVIFWLLSIGSSLSMKLLKAQNHSSTFVTSKITFQ